MEPNYTNYSKPIPYSENKQNEKQEKAPASKESFAAQKFAETKTEGKKDFSVQEMNLDVETNSNLQKINMTALQMLKIPEKKRFILEDLQKKVKTAYSSYLNENLELAKKSEKALSHFIANVEKIDPTTLLKNASEFEHYKDKSGIRIERYPDGQNFALLSMFIGKGKHMKVEIAIDLETFEPIARAISKNVEVKKSIENGVKIQRLVSGPEFVNILATCSYVGKNLETKTGVLMEYCRGGDLRDYGSEHLTEIDPSMQNRYWEFTTSLLSGLKKMAEKNIHHRDLKPENFLIAIDKQGKEKLKISDFDSAIIIEKGKFPDDISVGTARYLPPEFLKGLNLVGEGQKLIEENTELNQEGEDLIVKGYEMIANTKGDVWAMGIILLELRTSFVASMEELLGAKGYDLLQKISELKQDDVNTWFSSKIENKKVIENIEDLNYRMLQVDPGNRISAKEAWEAIQELKQTSDNFCVSVESLNQWITRLYPEKPSPEQTPNV